MKTIPRDYQKIGIKRLIRFDGRTLLADEMGLGKTLQILFAAKQQNWFPMIVVCPAGLKLNWEAEISNHINMRCLVLEKTKPTKASLRLMRSTKIIVVNYDILKFWLRYLHRIKPKLIAIDEAHYVSNRSTQRSKYVRQLCKKVPHVIPMSGTPLPNRPADLFPILQLIWPKEFPSFFSYAIKYCAPEKKPWGWEYKGATNLPHLHKRLRRLGMIRRRKADVLDELPAKARYVVPLDIDNRRQYDRAESDFLNWLRRYHGKRGNKAKKAEQLTKMGYLKRLAAELKLEAIFSWLDNFLAENDGKVLVFAIHKKIIRLLKERYTKISVVIDGSKSKKERRHAERAFQTNPKIRILFGNIKAAGVGLNLTAAHTVAIIELPWKPADCTQAEDRCYGRLNDLHGASIYYLLARDTIEEKLCKLIHRKQIVIERAIDGKRTKDFNLMKTLTKSYKKAVNK